MLGFLALQTSMLGGEASHPVQLSFLDPFGVAVSEFHPLKVLNFSRGISSTGVPTWYLGTDLGGTMRLEGASSRFSALRKCRSGTLLVIGSGGWGV